MNQGISAPRLRGVRLLLARAGALVVSIGTLLFLVTRAGLPGCSSRAPTSAVVAETEGHAPAVAMSAAPPSPSAQPVTTGGVPVPPATKVSHKGAYFPGSKAPTGNWAQEEPEPAPNAGAAPH
jgi:hypothetical protein